MFATDEALYAQLLGGDLRAFDTLYARHAKPLYGFARSQLGDAAAAEDVIHEAFLAVLRARTDRAELRSFRAWLFQVARNLCLNHVRATKRGTAAAERIAVEPAPESDVPASDPAALAAAVAKLPPNLAQVYELRASGMSYEELASILDVPLGTVKSRMHEMVKRLRSELT
ncbi:MAG TPA: sigma-70 family RNA polymerase sigma factor [Kofleriaceae bacterium]